MHSGGNGFGVMVASLAAARTSLRALGALENLVEGFDHQVQVPAVFRADTDCAHAVTGVAFEGT